MDPLVSIIIPVYKAEEFLPRCLDSIINQSYRHIEVIVVNDASPDNSQAIANEYAAKDPRVNAAVIEKSGTGGARNAGMEMARGEYLLFVDADDYIESDCVKCLIETAGATGADIVIANYKVREAYGRLSNRTDFDKMGLSLGDLKQSALRYEYFLGGGYYGVAVWGKLYNHRFIKDTGLKFDKDSEICAEDMLFNLKIFTYKPKIYLLNEYLYIYCINLNSITNTYKPDFVRRYLNMVINFDKHLTGLRAADQYRDLLDFISFNTISVSCEHAYKYSAAAYYEIKQVIRWLIESALIRQMIGDFARGQYISEVSEKKRKIFMRVQAVLLKYKLIGPAAVLQIIKLKMANVSRVRRPK